MTCSRSITRTLKISVPPFPPISSLIPGLSPFKRVFLAVLGFFFGIIDLYSNYGLLDSVIASDELLVWSPTQMLSPFLRRINGKNPGSCYGAVHLTTPAWTNLTGTIVSPKLHSNYCSRAEFPNTCVNGGLTQIRTLVPPVV